MTDRRCPHIVTNERSTDACTLPAGHAERHEGLHIPWAEYDGEQWHRIRPPSAQPAERTDPMTDHLTEARACLSRVDQAATNFSSVSWLTATCEHILDHLEAQQAAQRPATAPPAASQPEPGHRDTQCSDGVPDAEFDRWLNSISPEAREQITREIEAAERVTLGQIRPHFSTEYRRFFDRWLAAHDAEVRAQALNEAADDYRSGQISGIFASRDEYTKAWLRARAEQTKEDR